MLRGDGKQQPKSSGHHHKDGHKSSKHHAHSDVRASSDRDLDRQDSGFTEEQLLQIMELDGPGVAQFLSANGIKASTAALFSKHGITGKLCTIVQEQHLKEMGIDLIGERLKLMELLKKCRTGQRIANRNKILWEQLEFRPLTNAPCCPCVPFGFPCCCFLQPLRNIKLTRNNLQISGVNKEGCCEYTYYALCGCVASPNLDVNNIDLTRVTDVNRITKGKECCNVEQTWIQITAEEVETDAEQNERNFLKFTTKDGPRFERMLRNAVEENQNYRGFSGIHR